MFYFGILAPDVEIITRISAICAVSTKNNHKCRCCCSCPKNKINKAGRRSREVGDHLFHSKVTYLATHVFYQVHPRLLLILCSGCLSLFPAGHPFHFVHTHTHTQCFPYTKWKNSQCETTCQVRLTNL